MFGSLKFPKIKSKLSGATKSKLDPADIAIGAGVGAGSAALSYGIDQLLGRGWKIDLPVVPDITLIPQIWGSRDDELTRSIAAGVVGSAITFGVAALPLYNMRPKALLPAAVGAILNIIGWSVAGAIKYVTFIKKDMDEWRTNYWGVDYMIHQDQKTGRFQVRTRAPTGRTPNFIVAYLTTESQRSGMKDASNESRWLASTIDKNKLKLITANRRATEDGRPVLDNNGNVIRYSGLGFGTIKSLRGWL